MTQRTFTGIFPRIACAAVLALALTVPMTGCGGSGSQIGVPGQGNISRKNGQLTFTVAWPQATRLIPLRANSIVIKVSRAGGQSFTQTIVKPANFTDTTPPSTVSFNGLEVGEDPALFTYTVTATAFPETDGSGTAQASAQTTVGISTEDPSKTVSLTMGSTIKRVEVTPVSGFKLGPGRTRDLTATAYDAATGGSVVLLTPGKISWATSNPAAGTLSATTGQTVTFTGANVTNVAGVTTQITATETESGVVGAVPATIVVVPVGLAPSVWPKFHGDTANTGRAPQGATIATAPSAPIWTANVGGSVVFSSPAIGVDGNVYIGAYDSKLYAFTSAGTAVAGFPVTLDGQIEATPLISQDGTVYVGTLSGTMYAISPGGAIVWSRKVDGPIFGSATMDKNGFLYFASTTPAQTVYKVDSLNSAIAWSRVLATQATGASSVQAAPALSRLEDAVYVSAINGWTYSINAATGAVNWSSNPLPSGFEPGTFPGVNYSSGVVVAQIGGVDAVVYGTVDGRFFGLNGATGAKILDYDAAAPIYGTPTLSKTGDRVYFGTFDNVSGDEQSRLISLRLDAPGTGTLLSPAFKFGFTSSPALTADGTRFYIGNYDGRVYSIDTTTMIASWGVTTGVAGEQFDSSPAIGADGTIYLGGFAGRVYAFK